MRRKKAVFLLASALFTLSIATAPAQSPAPSPDAVEEDWKLVVANPDQLSVGPQITTVMSPIGDLSVPFFAFDMNYREYPFFAPGGMQVQVWSGGNVTGTSSQGNALLSNPNETITWTQRMSVGNGVVSYDINNGQSTSWGSFGQGSNLTASYQSTAGSLAAYSPDVSAAKSGASWQSNRVTSLKLVQVRYYANGQLISTDTNPRVIIAPPSDSD
jgi:hypothetical protein